MKNNNNVVRNIKIVALMVILGMTFSIVSEIYSTISLSYNISQASSENTKLKQAQDELRKEVQKLKDNNYLQSYVSGKNFVTEKGSNVYILPKSNKEGKN